MMLQCLSTSPYIDLVLSPRSSTRR
ncbi:unnamed protein product [Linum tenue]|uniref:Uncharacterized protein n=1 Tax=Linum tenue TaxID=586396 RepID=A0AAV0QQL8_9ROSI|nr:unnamed protein product [Linum tenue]